MANDWREYQEEAAALFRELGLEAQTNVTVLGVRTTHDIDALVKSSHAGFQVTWVVECKQWNSRVSKLHVLALREIVSDTGADRGILLAEAGVQSGAYEAAALTNVHITSLDALRKTASDQIFSMRLRELYDRFEECRQRYWDIPKDQRVRCGLRHDVAELGYSGTRVIEVADELLSKAFRGVYPITVGELTLKFSGVQIPTVFNSVDTLVHCTEQLVAELESKLKACTDSGPSTT